MRMTLLTLMAVAISAGQTMSGAGPSPSAGVEVKAGEFLEADHAPLLARLATVPEGLLKEAVTVTLISLGPDLQGPVVSVQTKYDSLESPSEVEVTVNEGGILDDDLTGFLHLVSLAMNKNGEWRIVGYQRAEVRRKLVE